MLNMYYKHDMTVKHYDFKMYVSHGHKFLPFCTYVKGFTFAHIFNKLLLLKCKSSNYNLSIDLLRNLKYIYKLK